MRRGVGGSQPSIPLSSVDDNGAVTGFNDGNQVIAMYYADSPPDGSITGGSGSGFVATVASGA
jgi:hypothetical protein